MSAGPRGGPLIAFAVAMDEQGVIGRANALPWHLPADLRHFKSVTLGKPIVMGRRTHESIGRALPGRHNIVVTRDRAYTAAGCTVVHSVAAALAVAGDAEEVVIIGGAELFEALLPRTERIYLTRIHARFQGDTFFPEPDPAQWREVQREDHLPDERNPHPYSFLVLERR